MSEIKSLNFTFFEKSSPELYLLGAFSEQYVQSDPASCLVKLRTLGEALLKDYFDRRNDYWPGSFMEALRHPYVESGLPYQIKNLFHSLRKAGNRAAHTHQGVATEAMDTLKMAHRLCLWYYSTFMNGDISSISQFQTPVSPKQEDAALKRKLLEMEAQLESQRKQLEAEMKARQEAMAEKQAIEASLREQQEQQFQEDIAQELFEEGSDYEKRSSEAMNTLQLSEAETRSFLIDTMLVQSGWKVAPKLESTEQVGKEVEVSGQPTPTGMGSVDYVLYDDSANPIALIEAKKTSKNPDIGLEQARLYAKALKKESGTDPIIILSNGYDIFLYDDKAGRIKVRLWGIPSKESLERDHWKRENKNNLNDVEINTDIAGGSEKRLYQYSAIKATLDSFQTRRDKALLVLATGTGKTRVATAITDALIRGNWVKRVLFLCDRLELRKQASNTFKEFLPHHPATFVTAKTYEDRSKRLYFATYPSMIKCFENFDVGFFDLIIADESHRSIYNKYRDLFSYFDALQIGLTATPVDFIERNTFRMFLCDEMRPTYDYSLAQAIEDEVLVPPKVFEASSQFSEDGISYSKMDDEQKSQLGLQVEDENSVDFGVKDLDRKIFNKDTNRMVLRNLMEEGVRDVTGSRPGKTIVFARNHDHAVLLKDLYYELYGNDFGADFCKVIDYHDSRAEKLIDDFKDPDNNLTIAISVDMLDTGIDVPQVVNLSFAKPVGSRVKFLQMLGRGTRLCDDLFGPGQHKESFYVFDHWKVFENFEHAEAVKESAKAASLLEQLFASRLRCMRLATENGPMKIFDQVLELVLADINALSECTTIAVKEKWKLIHSLRDKDLIKQFDAATIHSLETEITRLMRWRDSHRGRKAYHFDLRFSQLLEGRLGGSAKFEEFAAALSSKITKLKLNLSQVRAHEKLVLAARQPAFWLETDIEELDSKRLVLRGLMDFVDGEIVVKQDPLMVDVVDRDQELVESKVVLSELGAHQFKSETRRVLEELYRENPVLKKIRSNEPVTEAEIDQLCALVLSQNPTIDLKSLLEFFPKYGKNLVYAIRGIVGMDENTVRKQLGGFVTKHNLNARQSHFMELLISQVIKAGGIQRADLWSDPFTSLSSEGIDGVFQDENLVDEILEYIKPFEISLIEEEEQL